jgi:hypothetical protein
MTGTYAHKLVGEPLEFGAVNGGEPFPVVLARLDVYRPAGGEALPAVHALLDVDYETYVRMDEAGAFGFSLFSVDPATANAQFTHARDLELTLRADGALLPGNAASMSDGALLDAMLAGLTDDPDRFLDPNAWQWLSVLQAATPGGPALSGIRSKFPPR